ncbi:uncharacterized mitochondrial protein-like protein [Tanacetum coccineum]
MDHIIKLNDTDGVPLTDPTTNRTNVGKLIYFTLTRPDHSFAAQALSQFSHNPKTPHLTALQRVFRYIKLCRIQGIYFQLQIILNSSHIVIVIGQVAKPQEGQFQVMLFSLEIASSLGNLRNNLWSQDLPQRQSTDH